MRIAQISPLMEAVPPKLYGGTERMVSFITEELVRRGHEVTLFASGDSRTCARKMAHGNLKLRWRRKRRAEISTTVGCHFRWFVNLACGNCRD